MKSSVPKHLETGLLTDQYSTHVAQNIDIYVRAPTCYPITSNFLSVEQPHFSKPNVV